MAVVIMAGKTEWEDALIKHGIMEKPVVLPTQDELDLIAQEKAAEKDPLENKTVEELEEMEGDEETVLAKLRQKRLEKLKKDAALNKFGNVRYIQKPDFVREVNQAGAGIWVVVHLESTLPDSRLMAQHLETVARKFKAVKFLRIQYSDCIPNYPEAKTPTLIIYKDDDLKAQQVGLSLFGGQRMTALSLEWGLSQLGVLTTDLPGDPLQGQSVINVQKNYVRARNDSDSDNSDF
eukprot:g547.t1